MRFRVIEGTLPLEVLVVEDEPLIRLLAIDILEAAGCTVTCAASGAKALRAVTLRRFDVAVVGLGLPDASCSTVVRGLLAAQPGLGLVISTGRQADDPMVAAAREAGRDRVAAFLGKPWPEGALAAAVRRAALLDPPEPRHRTTEPRHCCGLTAG